MAYQYRTVGGTAPITFAVTSGSLPAGLTMSATGLITGTTTTAEHDNAWTVTATDADGNTATLADTAYVLDMLGDPPDADSEEVYSYTLTGTEGTAPYTFALTSGSLPDGLSLATDGEISGTTGTTVADYPFSVTKTDAAGVDTVKNYDIAISAAAITPKFLTTGGNSGPQWSDDGITWTNITSAAIGASDNLRGIAANGDTVIGCSDDNYIFRSLDRGMTWAKIYGDATWRNPQRVAYQNGIWLISSAGYSLTSDDDGDTWTETTFPTNATKLVAANGCFLRFQYLAAGVYRSLDGESWTRVSTFSPLGGGWNGSKFMVVGNNGSNYTSTTGVGWSAGTKPPGMDGNNSLGAAEGQDGYFIVGTWADASPQGLWKTTNNGATWTQVSTLHQTYDSSCSAYGIDIFGSDAGGGSLTCRTSSDGGATWTTVTSPAMYTQQIISLT